MILGGIATVTKKKFRFWYKKNDSGGVKSRILKFNTDFMESYSDGAKHAFICIFYDKQKRINHPTQLCLQYEVRQYDQALCDKMNAEGWERNLLNHHLQAAIRDYLSAQVFHINDHDSAILALDMLQTVYKDRT